MMRIATLLICLVMASCTVGPNFHPPRSITTPVYTKETTTQNFLYHQDLKREWWKTFHSNQINRLVHQGITANPDLSAAMFNLKVAEESLRAARGSLLFPSLDLNLSGERKRFAISSVGGSGAAIFNLLNASINADYTFDLFGKNRRQIEVSRATRDYAY